LLQACTCNQKKTSTQAKEKTNKQKVARKGASKGKHTKEGTQGGKQACYQTSMLSNKQSRKGFLERQM